MKRTFFIVVFLFLHLLAGRPRAESLGASSIEWLTCQSDVILIGQITNICVTKGVHSVIYEDCTVSIKERIKGEVKDSDTLFCLRTISANPTCKVFMNSKDGVLLFLSKSKGHGPERHLDNKYVPTSMSDPFSVLDLSNVPKGVYGKEMTVLADKEAILDVVRSWAHSRIAHSIPLKVPPTSPIRVDSLDVPAEEKYRDQYTNLAKSDKPHERVVAAAALSQFPGEATTRILRELLKDETDSFTDYASNGVSDGLPRVTLDVRATAYRSLQALGEPVPDSIQLERAVTEVEQRSLRERFWRRHFTEGLPSGWKVVSVQDDKARRVGETDTTSVVVTCGEGESRCAFTLIPKEWGRKDLPPGEVLGINGRDSYGARYFVFTGTMPTEVKEKVAKYFGLEKP